MTKKTKKTKKTIKHSNNDNLTFSQKIKLSIFYMISTITMSIILVSCIWLYLQFTV